MDERVIVVFLVDSGRGRRKIFWKGLFVIIFSLQVFYQKEESGVYESVELSRGEVAEELDECFYGFQGKGEIKVLKDAANEIFVFALIQIAYTTTQSTQPNRLHRVVRSCEGTTKLPFKNSILFRGRILNGFVGELG